MVRPAPLHVVSDGRRPRLLAGWAMDRAGSPASCLVLAGRPALASTPQIVTGLTIEVEKQLHDTITVFTSSPELVNCWKRRNVLTMTGQHQRMRFLLVSLSPYFRAHWPASWWSSPNLLHDWAEPQVITGDGRLGGCENQRPHQHCISRRAGRACFLPLAADVYHAHKVCQLLEHADFVSSAIRTRPDCLSLP